MDTAIPIPAGARTHVAERRVRLADVDATGRVRLDALARWLQDAAIDDVAETGWGVPEHLWFVRRIVLDADPPLADDRSVELVTWCSGVAALAAGRRWSVRGDAGGRVEVDSVWIHLDAEGRPTRIGGFGPYAEAAAGRAVSTRMELPDPPPDSPARAFPLRSADVDPHGHVNNAVHWQAVEEALLADGPLDPRRPYRAELDYREPLDRGDDPALVRFDDGAARAVALVARGSVRAVARLTQTDR